MQVEEMIAAAERELEGFDEQIDRTSKMLASLEEDASHVRSMLHFLREAQKYFAASAPSAPNVSPGAKRNWAPMPRTLAVRRALRSFGEQGAGPGDILIYLREHGRTDDSYNLVSAALTNLRNRGIARQVERGRWMYVAPAPTQPTIESALGDADAGTPKTPEVAPSG